jgi:AcrR family transcriptional regulator
VARQKLLQSRYDVLAAAAELFGKQGYRATTMADISDRLGVSKPTLYASFDSKEAILSEVIQSWTKSSDDARKAAFKEGEGPREGIRLLIQKWAHNAVTRRAFYMTFLADERELPAAIMAKYRRWSRASLHSVRDCIRDGQAKGVFRPDLDPTVAALALISFLNMIPEWFKADGRLSVDQVVDNYIALFERGLVVAPDGRRRPA